MIFRRAVLSLAIAACAGATLSLWAQGTSDLPVLKILSPDDEAFVTGPTLLRATIMPSDGATGVTFFVDGRQVCALTAPPFECDWDAGATITAHQIRAVATVQGGSRIVQTVRTKSVGYVERVDVDVVQVTVTVSDGRGKFVRSIPQAVSTSCWTSSSVTESCGVVRLVSPFSVPSSRS